jgi:hypothetical protein
VYLVLERQQPTRQQRPRLLAHKQMPKRNSVIPAALHLVGQRHENHSAIHLARHHIAESCPVRRRLVQQHLLRGRIPVDHTDMRVRTALAQANHLACARPPRQQHHIARLHTRQHIGNRRRSSLHLSLPSHCSVSALLSPHPPSHCAPAAAAAVRTSIRPCCANTLTLPSPQQQQD